MSEEHSQRESAWVPFELLWNDAPIDVSFLYADERPAGRHGFLTVSGNRFVFEDGSPGRFWGANFNGGANFPSHAESEQVAERLAKFGLNLVRFHQMDADWSTPNLFQFNRAEPLSNTRSFDERSLDRVDYLIACLKEHGIYVYLDLLTYRRFLPGDGVAEARKLPAAGKPYTYFDPTLIELQKEFNRNLWTHVNPYTGLAYKDDPAIVLVELKNESDLFTQSPTLEPYRSDLEAMLIRWTHENELEPPQTPVDFTQPDPVVSEFFVHVQRAHYADMYGHLRELGVRVPIAGTNWSINVGIFAAQSPMDFTDTHWYWNFPFWETESGTDAKPMVRTRRTPFAWGLIHRDLDRPFFVSEWDHAWPDEWRAESPLATAAVGALQGWGGFAIHTYRYATHGPVDRIGGGASTVDGVTYRNHFDSFNDPAKFGLFYHAALLFRRGDVKPALERAVVQIDGAVADWRRLGVESIPAVDLLAEMHQTGLALPGQSVAAAHVYRHDQPIELPSDIVESDTGELARDLESGIAWIDTERTKAIYGFIGSRPTVSIDGLELRMRTDFATIAVSSLTDAPIRESRNLLLTAVGRSDNTGTRYSADRKRQFDFGHGPVLIEAVEGEIAIATTHLDLEVWVVGVHGEAVTRLPVEHSEGWLRFSIGPQPSWNQSTIFYLIR